MDTPTEDVPIIPAGQHRKQSTACTACPRGLEGRCPDCRMWTLGALVEELRRSLAATLEAAA